MSNVMDSVHSKKIRGAKQSIPDDQKDEKYYERRKRNNMAAKKSRDARKMREQDTAVGARVTEQENSILRVQLATLRHEANALKALIMYRRQWNTTRSQNARQQPTCEAQNIKVCDFM